MRTTASSRPRASATSFAVGATIPLVVVIATPRTIMPLAVATIALTALTALTALAALGGLAARAGGAGVARGVARYVLQRARDGDDVRRRPRARLDRSNALR